MWSPVRYDLVAAFVAVAGAHKGCPYRWSAPPGSHIAGNRYKSCHRIGPRSTKWPSLKGARCQRARTNPLPGTSSCSPSTSSTASAAWAKACRSRSRPTAAASSGSRTRARRRISPPSTSPIRASPRWWCRPTCRRAHMRSNSLETSGNLMAVAYQTQKKGLQPAGFELFDISVPEKPKSISFFDCSGPTSRGVHQLWFCDGEYVHTRFGRTRLQRRRIRPTTSSTAASTCAIRRSRSRSVAGICPAPSRATTSCRRRATPWTRAIARTTPTSIRSAPTAAISPISTAACSSSTSPTRRTRRRSRPGPTRRPTPASCTPSCRCSTAGSCWSPTRPPRTTARTGRS